MAPMQFRRCRVQANADASGAAAGAGVVTCFNQGVQEQHVCYFFDSMDLLRRDFNFRFFPGFQVFILLHSFFYIAVPKFGLLLTRFNYTLMKSSI